MKNVRPANEAELLRRAKRKDTAALKNLYETYSQYLFALCRRYMGDADSAEDVLQESFIRIFDSLDKFEYRGEGSLRAWMGKIVVNQALMALRSAKRLTVLHIDGFSEKDLGPEEEPQPEGIPAEALQNMIAALPDGYRTVFNLYIFEQMSHKEIAKRLGISENTSFSQFSRAKRLLAKWIKEYKQSHDE